MEFPEPDESLPEAPQPTTPPLVPGPPPDAETVLLLEVAPPKPRLYPTILVAICSPVVFLGFAMVCYCIALLIMVLLGKIDRGRLGDADYVLNAMVDMATRWWGMLLVVTSGQLLLLGAALAAGRLSPVPLRQRLGLVRSRLPL